MDADDDEGHEIIKLGEFINSMEEEDAIVRGGVEDESICSFIKGYVKRQALYTCKTCFDITKVHAGFCYPCAMNCHADHDRVELYTKRRFRCDCGNSKFPNQCQLWEEKDDINALNTYNHNFSNVYCQCKRPYPDEDFEDDEEMLQCGICEDWFHPMHLNLGTPYKIPEDYEELTCFDCLEKLPFLVLYSKSSDNTKDSETNDCRLKRIAESLGVNGDNVHEGSIFDLGLSIPLSSILWPPGWRQNLCDCSACKVLYDRCNVNFLLDPEDTMKYYMELGKKRTEEMCAEDSVALSRALSDLPRPVAINVASGVNNLRLAIQEFLSKERDSDHVVTEDEVRAFFQELRKRQFPE